ncbi:hypothetical protein MMC27_002747 [Xylographa pallens]|nr:hypothetical protein [Xylographa pallens]
MAATITFDEWLACSALSFEWGESYDTKDWGRLAAIITPELNVDYTDVTGKKWPSISAADFVTFMSRTDFLGDPLIDSQHFLGASKYEKMSADEILGYHQLRAAHQRYTDAEKKTVEAKGHCHCVIMHRYKKVDGVWKFAGLRPTIRWNEYDFHKMYPNFKD